jgi:hypothetical protein
MKKKFLIESLIGKVKKIIISERKTDKLSLELSRLVINKFKSKQNISVSDIYFERGDEYAVFDFTCNFYEDENFEEPFSVNASGDMENIDIDITFNPNDFPKSMNDLVAEVKETIEHELEHVEQQNFEDMGAKYEDYGHEHEDDDYNYKYLTSKNEIPAYVRGLIKRANTKQITLDDAMDEWFKENQRKFGKKSDWVRVKKVWKKYANRMKEKNKLKKFR